MRFKLWVIAVQDAFVHRPFENTAQRQKGNPAAKTLILFPNAPDNISALVFESNTGARCWKRKYDSVQEVVDELSEAGIATAEDARELQTRLMTEESCPLFHAAVEVRDLEDWGFTLVGSERVN